ncbi:MAG: hypothetical protein K2Q14_08675, partial [Gammaproteobacteria bacterium]|nr:hypothetical protein [Gammaproteobacteria bacterium]
MTKTVNKKPIQIEKNAKPIRLEQKIQIQLRETELEQMQTQLNLLPALFINAFLIPWLMQGLYNVFFSETHSLLNKFFVRLHMHSDEMDPVVLSMAIDDLDAQSVLESLDQGNISYVELVEIMAENCKQIIQSDLLKKLNYKAHKLSLFMQECRLDFSLMSEADLRLNYKKIADKLMVVRSLSVENILAMANKKQHFISFLGVFIYQILAKNTINKWLYRLNFHTVFYTPPRFIGKTEQRQLTENTANAYLEELYNSKILLMKPLKQQTNLLRILMLSVGFVYFFFRVSEGPLSIIFFGLMNIVVSSLWQEMAVLYHAYNKEKNEKIFHDKIQQITRLLACNCKKKELESGAGTYFMLHFQSKQKINHDEYPMSSARIISIMVKVLQQHNISASHDKRNTIIIKGSYSISDKKWEEIIATIMNNIRNFSKIHDAIKKVKKLFCELHYFGVEFPGFINESLGDKHKIKVSVSLFNEVVTEKIQTLVLLLTGQKLSIFNCFNQSIIGEFFLEGKIELVVYYEAISLITQWKSDEKNKIKIDQNNRDAKLIKSPSNDHSETKKICKKSKKQPVEEKNSDIN